MKNIKKEQLLFKTANLHPKDTGLSSELYALYNGKFEIKQDEAIVKVNTTRGLLPIEVGSRVLLSVNMRLKEDDQKRINEAIYYIKKHKQIFLDHWEGKITDKELMDKLFCQKF